MGGKCWPMGPNSSDISGGYPIVTELRVRIYYSPPLLLTQHQPNCCYVAAQSNCPSRTMTFVSTPGANMPTARGVP